MAPDPKSAEGRAALHRSAELIINRLADYLSIRFDLACRINPQLKAIKHDRVTPRLLKEFYARARRPVAT